MRKLCLLMCLLVPGIGIAEGLVKLKAGELGVVGYQAEPLESPNGGTWDTELFEVDHFIHPLKTPDGFVITESNPVDHPHHMGLWWPWKHIQNGDRKLITWDMQTQQGLVRAVSHRLEGNTLFADAEYVDRLAEGGEQVLINETAIIQTSEVVEQPAKGYFVDITITQTPAVDREVIVPVYRYSGFSLRGNLFWDKDNSSVLTSDGKDRSNSNGTRAEWIRIQGANPDGGDAGIVLMTHPENHTYPEKIRTWNEKWKNGAVFVNFNPVMENQLVLQPGKTFVRKYRLFVYDGEISAEQADTLQQDYAKSKPKFYPFDNGLTDIESVDEQARLLKRLGYDGICSRPSKCTPELLAAFDKYGLKVPASYMNLKASVEEMPYAIKKHMEMLNGRDTKIWLTVYEPNADTAQAVSIIRKVCDEAKKNGLDVILYPHVGARTDTAMRSHELCEMADRDNLGISFNVCHFLAQNEETKLEETIRTVGPNIKLVQISGANMIPEPKSDWNNLILPLGDGTFDMNRVFQTLEEVGYTGDFNLQCYKIAQPAEEHLTKSINAWRKYNEQP